jgi:hypothetical protein
VQVSVKHDALSPDLIDAQKGRIYLQNGSALRNKHDHIPTALQYSHGGNSDAITWVRCNKHDCIFTKKGRGHNHYQHKSNFHSLVLPFSRRSVDHALLPYTSSMTFLKQVYSSSFINIINQFDTLI